MAGNRRSSRHSAQVWKAMQVEDEETKEAFFYRYIAPSSPNTSNRYASTDLDEPYLKLGGAVLSPLGTPETKRNGFTVAQSTYMFVSLQFLRDLANDTLDMKLLLPLEPQIESKRPKAKKRYSPADQSSEAKTEMDVIMDGAGSEFTLDESFDKSIDKSFDKSFDKPGMTIEDETMDLGKGVQDDENMWHSKRTEGNEGDTGHGGMTEPDGTTPMATAAKLTDRAMFESLDYIETLQNPPIRFPLQQDGQFWDSNGDIFCFTFPLRTQAGALHWYRTAKTFSRENPSKNAADWAALKKAWAQAFEGPLGLLTKSGAFRPRSEDIRLQGDLFIEVHPTVAQVRLQRSTYAEALEDVRTCIDTIMAARGPVKPGLTLCKDQSDTVGKVFLSTDPFGIYSTWIEDASFQQYMKSLATGIGRVNDKADGAGTTTASTKVPAEIDPVRALPSDKGDNRKALLDAMKTKEKKAMEDDSTAQQRPTRKKGEEQAEATGKKASAQAFQTILVVPVSSDKMDRKTEDKSVAPGTVMGHSAPEMAHKWLSWQSRTEFSREGEELKKHQMSNWLYIAEVGRRVRATSRMLSVLAWLADLWATTCDYQWLHLAARSWGGLLSLEEREPQFVSSDIPQNLVLGTSETNSLMTRYEKAWQKLLRDETKLRKAKEVPFTGELRVVRNPSAVEATSMCIGQDRLVSATDKYTRTIDCVSTTENATEHLVEWAREVRFIAYSIDYSITFSHLCSIISLPAGASLETRFHPFVRPFFHRLEMQLDAQLYSVMQSKTAGNDLQIPTTAQTPGAFSNSATTYTTQSTFAKRSLESLLHNQAGTFSKPQTTTPTPDNNVHDTGERIRKVRTLDDRTPMVTSNKDVDGPDHDYNP